MPKSTPRENLKVKVNIQSLIHPYIFPPSVKMWKGTFVVHHIPSFVPRGGQALPTENWAGPGNKATNPYISFHYPVGSNSQRWLQNNCWRSHAGGSSIVEMKAIPSTHHVKLVYHTPIAFTGIWLNSGTPLNRHPSTADTHDIMDNSESPDCPSIHFNT